MSYYISLTFFISFSILCMVQTTAPPTSDIFGWRQIGKLAKKDLKNSNLFLENECYQMSQFNSLGYQLSRNRMNLYKFQRELYRGELRSLPKIVYAIRDSQLFKVITHDHAFAMKLQWFYNPELRRHSK